MTQSRDWQTESFRFTFLGCPDAAASLITWASLVGREADSVTVKKAQGLRNEEGIWDGMHLSISATPGRVDILLNPVMPESMPNFEAIPNIGELQPVAQRLCDRLTAMTLPASSRLAVGAKMMSFTDDSASALTLMKKYLPFLEVDLASIDVAFQHNLPKRIRQSGIDLNRLSKWGQMTMHFIPVMPQPGQGVPPGVARVTHGLQVELDINTSPNSNLPAPAAYAPIIREMFAELVATSPLGG